MNVPSIDLQQTNLTLLIKIGYAIVLASGPSSGPFFWRSALASDRLHPTARWSGHGRSCRLLERPVPVMDDLQTDDLLRQLRSRDPREAWARFLELYSPLLFDVARRFERDDEAVADCYLYICEQLSANRFGRLLRFRPDGPARFSTWLCAVARNLCLDWYRREFGRYRVFESVARLPALDQEVFRGLFVERLPIEDLFLKLEPRHRG